MTSVVRELECPASRAISSTGTPEADSRLTKLVRSSRGVQSSPIPATLQMALNCRLTFSGVQLRPYPGREDQAVIVPQSPSSQLLPRLPPAVLPQRFTSRVGQPERPA